MLLASTRQTNRARLVVVTASDASATLTCDYDQSIRWQSLDKEKQADSELSSGLT